MDVIDPLVMRWINAVIVVGPITLLVYLFAKHSQGKPRK